MKTTAWVCAVGWATTASLVAVLYEDAFREILEPLALRIGAVVILATIVASVVIGVRRPRWRAIASIVALGLTLSAVLWAMNVVRGIVALHRLEGAVAYACEVNPGSSARDVFRLTTVTVPANAHFECRADHRHVVAARPFASTVFFSFAEWSYQYDVARFILAD